MRTAFVTGAASGIGLAIARRLAHDGVIVAMADRNVELLEVVAGDVPRAEAIALDVTDRDAFKDAVARFAARHGRLDSLFNNAGIAVGGEVRDMTPDHWRRVLDVNLNGVIHGVDAAYSIMIAQGFGHLVNVASVAGLVPFPGESVYCASKFAVVGLSHALRAEAADLGVHVSVVCPGVVSSAIWDVSEAVGLDKDAVRKRLPKGVTPDAAAKRILRGVRRNEATIVVTRHAQMMWWAHRLSPRLVGVAARLAARAVRRAYATSDR